MEVLSEGAETTGAELCSCSAGCFHAALQCPQQGKKAALRAEVVPLAGPVLSIGADMKKLKRKLYLNFNEFAG